MAQVRRLLWLTLLVSACSLPVRLAWAEDAALWLQMQSAYARGEADTLYSLRSRLKDTALAPLAEYWVLSSRLANATEPEVEAFLHRWVGTYYEDRLRGEWMRWLAKRGEWAALLRHNALFRMQDNDNLHCWVATARWHLQQPVDVAQVQTLWRRQKGVLSGCVSMAQALHGAGRLPASVIFEKVRTAVEYGQRDDAQTAAAIVSPRLAGAVRQVIAQPEKRIGDAAGQPYAQEVRTWAWIRQLKNKASEATAWRQTLDAADLTLPQKQWAQAVQGTWMALNQMPEAVDAFPRAARAHMSETHREWRLRSAIRAERWDLLLQWLEAMPAEAAAEPVWRYWQAVALRQLGGPRREKQAHALAQTLAQEEGYYGALAAQAWHLPASLATHPSVDAAVLAQVQTNPGLVRARTAMALGLHREGAREWHYTIALHERGGWPPELLRAAAQWACDLDLWDRCINTSLRIGGADADTRRFPTPWREPIEAAAREAGVDPALAFGLMRQESRFVDVARSSVGASGLMQLMPGTAKWTAHRIGMGAQELSRWRESDVNLRLGMHYFAHVLQGASGSLPLAAAAYNAGPKRVERWLPPEPVDMVRWIESIPFNETRDYVQKVTFNTWKYRSVLALPFTEMRDLLGDSAHVGMVRPDASDP